MAWESPIKLDYTPFWEQIVDAQENAIYKAVLKVNITVDREELVKALKYDRGQYEKGYADGYEKGYNAAMEIFLAKGGANDRPDSR